MAERVCPWWCGYLLANPLRKAFQDPKVILGGYLKPGMNMLDLGCAMGFFSLPAAELVGENGRVYGVDLQIEMVDALKRRAAKAGLSHRIIARQCSQESLMLDDLSGTVDFALAFAVIHEVPDAQNFFAEVKSVLKSGGRLLIAEPRGHVNQESFERTVHVAQKSGFDVVDYPDIRRSLAVVMRKKD